MGKLRAEQLNPRSPSFRQWLTPQQFGERFGQSPELYSGLAAYLRAAGLNVIEAPSRAFIEAMGNAQQFEALLGIRFNPVEGQPTHVHTFTGKPHLPQPFQSAVLYIDGLDTRPRWHHNIKSGSANTFGPQDLRRFYDADTLLNAGWVAQGQKSVVLSTQTAANDPLAKDSMEYYLRNISDVRTPFIIDVMPGAQNDPDPQPGASVEFALDVEMQSVGNVNGTAIVLLVSPASTVFSIGANGVVNRHPDATTVSISLGTCEPNLSQQPGIASALQNAVIQGTMEGQTWFAASGDNGAKDCVFSQGQTMPAVDFPSDVPEMMAAGGSEVKPFNVDANGAVAGYQQEIVWNDGNQGGAAGGGLSAVFALPAYQLGLVPDGGRSVPDIAMIAGLPGVAVLDTSPPGSFESPAVEGTSVASPLSAGLFALIASRVGCRLGDVHSALYAIGVAADAGAFHDITSGNLTFSGITGPSAGPGFDSASGWGSIDVAALAAAFPACPLLPDGGTPAPIDAGAAYDACGYACDGGMSCTTLPGGPSTCEPACDPMDGGCAVGSVCSTKVVFAGNGQGSCVPGCTNDADCSGGQVCGQCAGACIDPGSPNGHIGDACTSAAMCPTSGVCQTEGASQGILKGGYCTQACDPMVTGGPCACPGDSSCITLGGGFGQPQNFCFKSCATSSDCRPGGNYVCQPLAHGSPVCLPKCQLLSFGGFMFDTCQAFETPGACNTMTGLCGSVTKPDSGMPVPDAGQLDAGQPDAGPIDQTVTLPAIDGGLGASAPGGCGCGAAGDLTPLLLGLLTLIRRRRQ
jgi:MYXO-CTERM domain-containing protein